jgi:hypothetical protein
MGTSTWKALIGHDQALKSANRPAQNVARSVNGTSPTGSSDEFEAGEEVTDFEGGSFRSVGAVRAIHLDAGAEIAADGAWPRLLGIGRTHDLAPLGNGALGFKDHGEDFARAHEVGELSEERTLTVDSVEASGFFLGEAHRFDGHDREAVFVDARENFTL